MERTDTGTPRQGRLAGADSLVRPRTSGRWVRLAVVAVPLMWAPLTLLHPYTLNELLNGSSSRWITVHAAQLLLTPLLALGVLWTLAPRTARPRRSLGSPS